MNKNKINYIEYSIINISQIDEIIELEQAVGARILPELISILKTQIEVFLTQSAKPSESNYLLNLNESSHKLKSSCGNLGLTNSQQLLKIIEDNSSANDCDFDFAEILSRLAEQVKIDISELERYLNSRNL